VISASSGTKDAVGRAEIESRAAGVVEFKTRGWEPGRYDVALHDEGGGSALAKTTFWVQPEGATPEISTSRASYRAGEPFVVGWRYAPGNRADWVAVYARGADPHDVPSEAWQHTRSAVEGSLTFDDRVPGFPLEPGDYTIRLLEDDGFDTLAAVDFAVTD